MSKWKPMPGMRVTLLWKMRKERGLRQQDLAVVMPLKGLRVDQADVSNIENHGEHVEMGAEKLRGALEWFAQLLGYDGDPHDLLKRVRIEEVLASVIVGSLFSLMKYFWQKARSSSSMARPFSLTNFCRPSASSFVNPSRVATAIGMS